MGDIGEPECPRAVSTVGLRSTATGDALIDHDSAVAGSTVPGASMAGTDRTTVAVQRVADVQQQANEPTATTDLGADRLSITPTTTNCAAPAHARADVATI